MKKSCRDIDVTGKRVIVRCDLNVPLDKDGVITDDNRIVESLPTVTYLIDKGARVVLCSHLGRPKGKVDPKYTLKPVAKRLEELLKRPVSFADNCVGEGARQVVGGLKDGEVCLLENTRFHEGEEKNDPALTKELASLGDIFVNDAFGTAHRAHASTAGIADYLPSVCGFLIEKELRIMGNALENPERPFFAVLGGAKVSDKIPVIENLLEKVDGIIIGGAMAFTFIKALGGNIGKSLCENEMQSLAMELINKAKMKNIAFYLPVDAACAESFDGDETPEIFACNEIPENMMGMDIGPETISLFTEALATARTIIWNGPMGVFEQDRFKAGTHAVCKAIASSSAISIVGGGDSATAAISFGFGDQFTHISTGGGASLEFLEGKKLPGIECLTDGD